VGEACVTADLRSFATGWPATAEDNVNGTSSGICLPAEENIVANALFVDVGGTGAITDIGRWSEKKDARVTSDDCKCKSGIRKHRTHLVSVDAAWMARLGP
jgi:hypothetical protein